MALSIDDIRILIRATTNSSDQRQYGALQALGTVEGGLQEMAKYGFFYGLEQGFEHQAEEWPKMVYKAGGESKVVAGEDELKALGEGWGSLGEAQSQRDPQDGPLAPARNEPADATRDLSAFGTDPNIIANGEAREAGKQARRDGKALDEAPAGLLGDAWRAGYTEEAAWEEHDKAGDRAKPEENTPVAAGAPNDPTPEQTTSGQENKTPAGKTKGAK